MAIVEIDTLQRVRDMSETFEAIGGPVTSFFRPARIEAVTIEGSSFLLMNGENGGIGVASIGTNGALDFQQSFGGQFNPLEGEVFGNLGLTSFETSQGTHLFVTGGNTELFESPGNFSALGLSSFRVNDEGELNYLRGVAEPGLFGATGALSSRNKDPQIVTIGETDILITPVQPRGGVAEPGFQTYRIRDNGTLNPLRESAAVTQDNDDFAVVTVGSKAFVVAASPFGAFPAQVLQLRENGSLTPVFELPQSDQAIFNQNITETAGVSFGDRAFVYMANNTGGNILGYEVLSSGRLQLVENERPSIGDDWTFPATMDVFEDGGRYYLAAGSNALVVFEISEGGALTEVDEIPEMFRSRIVGAEDLVFHDIGGEQFIFASTTNLDEVRSYRFVQEDDRITLGGADNVRRGTDADNQIFSRAGDDEVFARSGDDMVDGGTGNDTLYGQNGNDSLFGGDGDDTLLGGDGFDFLFGGDGRDELRGGSSIDYLYGDGGADRLFGDSSADVLDGGFGNDLLRGGTGTDRLIDGGGSDRLFGDDQADTFELVRDNKLDVIRDFEDNVDVIDLTRWADDLEFSDLTITQFGDNVRIVFETETLEVRSADGQIFDFELSLSDFVFAM